MFLGHSLSATGDPPSILLSFSATSQFLSCIQLPYTRKRASPKCLCLGFCTLAELKGLETDGHVLRKAMGFKLEGNILILKPLLIIIEHQNQYFLAMFDYVVKKMLILGRSRDPTWQVCADWTSWNGYPIWKSLGKAFGWKIDSSQPAVYEAGWITVNDLLIAKI